MADIGAKWRSVCPQVHLFLENGGSGFKRRKGRAGRRGNPLLSSDTTEESSTESSRTRGHLLNAHDYKENFGITPLIEHSGKKAISSWGVERFYEIGRNGPSVFTPRLAQRGCGPWLCSLLLLLALLFLVGGNNSMC